MWGAVSTLTPMTDFKVLSIKMPTPFFEGTSNAYVLFGEPLTLVDTGVASEAGLAALEKALEGRGRRVEDIERIVLTHKHADHMGLAATLKDLSGAEVYVHEADLESVALHDEREEQWARIVIDRMRAWGVPSRILDGAGEFRRGRPVLARSVAATPFIDGQTLPMNGERLEILHMPGHTMGSACVRWGRRLFSGDHVLPEITPNVGIGELERADTLALYLASLERAARLAEAELTVFPGHGEPFGNLADRAHEIIRHHHERLDLIVEMLAREGPRTIYEVALGLFGEMKGFHLALGTAEAHAHAAHLVREGKVVQRDGRIALA